MTPEEIQSIDKYCELCMDINCTDCEYHDVHFRNKVNNEVIEVTQKLQQLPENRKITITLDFDHAGVVLESLEFLRKKLIMSKEMDALLDWQLFQVNSKLECIEQIKSYIKSHFM